MIRKYGLVFIVSLVLGATGSWAQQLPTSRAEIQLSFAPLVAQVSPAVVNIYTKTINKNPIYENPVFNDPFFKEFFEDSLFRQAPQVQQSLGSGVFVSPEGLIVTNNHVIEDSDEVVVVLSDGREFNAKVVAADQRFDLALLRINGKGEQFPALTLRDSDKVQIGELVLAIGNPYGFSQTVTSGIISALARTDVGIADFTSFIQTDAAINPGNSGGALITLDGQLIGINTAIYSRSGGSVGIGFAIPSNMVKAFLRAEKTGGRLIRAWLGAYSQDLSSEQMKQLGLRDRKGSIVTQLFPDGPADQGGLKVGDVVLSLNGRIIENSQALRFQLATIAPGDVVTLVVLRNQQNVSLQITLIAPPNTPPLNETTLKGETPLTGAIVGNISPAFSERYSFEGFWSGVIILNTQRGSLAGRAGLLRGDIILAVNQQEIKTVAELQDILQKNQTTRPLQVRIWRQGEVRNINFR
ncbi:MAG: Do family serine endopeptidase [Alphaproteobacteria bacterium]|nr:Do family serine endopeptidase [Alphaproteobacteria bacterium]